MLHINFILLIHLCSSIQEHGWGLRSMVSKIFLLALYSPHLQGSEIFMGTPNNFVIKKSLLFCTTLWGFCWLKICINLTRVSCFMILNFQCESSRVWDDIVSRYICFYFYFLVQTDSDKNKHKGILWKCLLLIFTGLFMHTYIKYIWTHTNTQAIFCCFCESVQKIMKMVSFPWHPTASQGSPNHIPTRYQKDTGICKSFSVGCITGKE